MSDVERIPSMRKPSRQGVPKRKPRDMAKPLREGKTKDAPAIPPKSGPRPAEATLSTEPTLSAEPTLPEEPMLPFEATLALEPAAEPEPELEPEPASEPEPEPVVRVEAEPAPVPEPESRPVPVLAPAPNAADAPPLTLRALVARVDAAWAVFRAAAYRFPSEHMNDHITEDGWTRKQMLAHIAVWHDLTADRLVKLMLTGRSVTLDREQDAINAAAARVAIGKTGGEVLKDVESTFNRLRRQMLRLSDAQLRLEGAWAAEKIAGNTYEHYAEHIAELTPPQPLPGSGAQS